MGPVTEKGEETRDRILATARHAFAERGYDGASLNDLIRAAEITKGGFYFHFPSKAALALAVIDDTKASVRERIMSHVTGEHALEQLVGLVKGAFAACDSDSMEAVSRLCDALARDPEVADQVELPSMTWEDTTRALIERAQAEGDIPEDVDAGTAATLAVAGFFGLELICRDTPERMPALRDPYIEFVLTAVHARRRPA